MFAYLQNLFSFLCDVFKFNPFALYRLIVMIIVAEIAQFYFTPRCEQGGFDPGCAKLCACVSGGVRFLLRVWYDDSPTALMTDRSSRQIPAQCV